MRMQGLSMLKKRRRKRRKRLEMGMPSRADHSGTDVNTIRNFERRRLRLRPDFNTIAMRNTCPSSLAVAPEPVELACGTNRDNRPQFIQRLLDNA